ncbi:MAG TPA: S41 family peptidase [Candidatus Dormibacteraeota bacterium]|nr:S41 family peptidase [Candidatus Dormibacteraeota bacterium]
MSRFLLAHFTVSILAANLFAQSLAPSAPRNSPVASKSSATSSPSPSATPTAADLINSLGAADLQAAITLLKSNFTNSDAITETELNRATVQGLMTRLPNGVKLLPNPESSPPEAQNPLYSEILDGHIGYLRLGSLNNADLQTMDKSLSNFTGKKVDALVVDLRASSGTNDFAVAAEFAKRFCPKGKPLFTLRKPAARQDRVFNSDRDPAFRGLIMVLADGDTAGGAEAVAAALRGYDKALLVGQPSAGRAAEYSDLALPGGKILRVAVAEMVSPEGHSLFPDGIKPDLPVEMSIADKLQIFQLSGEKGMGPFVYQAGRPHMNEAALLAGTNPELEAVEAAQQRRGRAPEKPPAHDPVLQRALDVVTSLEIYQKR